MNVTEVATVPIPQVIRTVFFGTPSYAVPALRSLAGSSRFEVALVVTQPDRTGGRRGTIEPAVKSAAIELGLPVEQPSTLRDEAVRERFREIEADLFVVAAYGIIFSQAILDMPLSGCINLHASILPAYRGAAPIPAAILKGDHETGVTLMVMERGLDTGPIIAIARTSIEQSDTTETLTARLAEIGADLALQLLPDLVAGEIVPTPQPDGGSLVSQLTKADGQIDWTRPADEIERHVRAMWPWPRAWSVPRKTEDSGQRTDNAGQQLQIHRATVVDSVSGSAAGIVQVIDGQPVVACGTGALRIDVAQAAGSKPTSGADLVRGRVLNEGDQCAQPESPHTPFILPLQSPTVALASDRSECGNAG